MIPEAPDPPDVIFNDMELLGFTFRVTTKGQTAFVPPEHQMPALDPGPFRKHLLCVHQNWFFGRSASRLRHDRYLLRQPQSKIPDRGTREEAGIGLEFPCPCPWSVILSRTVHPITPIIFRAACWS